MWQTWSSTCRNTDTQTSRQTQGVFLSPAPWCRWMPLAADPESTLGHYNKRRGPTGPVKWREQGSLGRRATLPVLWGNNLDTVICLSYTGLRPTDTHTHRGSGPALAISALLLWYCIRGANRVHLKILKMLQRGKSNGWQKHPGFGGLLSSRLQHRWLLTPGVRWR